MNVACNYSQAKYKKLKCKITDLLSRWLAQHWNKLIWKENVFKFKSNFQTIFTLFEMIIQREIHHLLHNPRAPNYAWVLSGVSGIVTQIVITYLFHLQWRTEHTFRAHDRRMYKREVHSLIIVSLLPIKPSMSGVLVLFWLGSFLEISLVVFQWYPSMDVHETSIGRQSRRQVKLQKTWSETREWSWQFSSGVSAASTAYQNLLLWINHQDRIK